MVRLKVGSFGEPTELCRHCQEAKHIRSVNAKFQYLESRSCCEISLLSSSLYCHISALFYCSLIAFSCIGALGYCWWKHFLLLLHIKIFPLTTETNGKLLLCVYRKWNVHSFVSRALLTGLFFNKKQVDTTRSGDVWSYLFSRSVKMLQRGRVQAETATVTCLKSFRHAAQCWHWVFTTEVTYLLLQRE